MKTKSSNLALLLLFFCGISYSQSVSKLKVRLDSLNFVLKNQKNELSIEQESILRANIYQTKSEIDRTIKNSDNITKLEQAKLPEAYSENLNTRGETFIPFEDYYSYLKEVNTSLCCNNLVNWSYENYSLSYSEFISLPIITNRMDFKNIDYPLLHAAIFYQTNKEREAYGLPALQFNQSLETAAFDHAKDMRTYNFFSHTSVVPGKKSVGDRVRQAGFSWSWVGENIAITFGIAYKSGTPVYSPCQNGGYFSYEYQGDPILSHTYLSFANEIVTQWMNSPGHRANILNSNYKYLGVGTAHFKDAGFYMMDEFYGVQVFAQ